MLIPFRVARPASPLFNCIKSIAALFLIWVWFLGVAPKMILHVETLMGLDKFRVTSAPLIMAGCTILLVSSLFAIYCNLVLATKGEGTLLPFDAPRKLVTNANYRDDIKCWVPRIGAPVLSYQTFTTFNITYGYIVVLSSRLRVVKSTIPCLSAPARLLRLSGKQWNFRRPYH